MIGKMKKGDRDSLQAGQKYKKGAKVYNVRDFKDLILIIFGSVIDGLSVLSDGKSNPISLILVLVIFPI